MAIKILTDNEKQEIMDSIDIPTSAKDDALIMAYWYCGCYVGQCKWHGTKVYELDKCYTFFSTVENLSDFEDGSCVAICPKCKADLAQAADHIGSAHRIVQVGKDLVV